MSRTLRTRVVALTLGVWCVGVAIFETVRVWTALSGPPDVEEYVNHLDFQLLASGFLVVTRWVPILVSVLIVEMVTFWLVLVVRARRRVPRS